MSSPKPSNSANPGPRPCPQGCGFSLHERDHHDACPVCLGILHARRALNDPQACAFCRQLRISTLERRVKFVERILGQAATAAQDPLLSDSSEPLLGSEGDLEGSGGTVVSWADQMEEISELELAAPQQLAAPLAQTIDATEDEIFDLGLDEHGFSEDEDQPDLQATQAIPPVETDNTFFALYRRAAQKLDVEWPPTPPAQKPTRFSGFFLPQTPSAAKPRLPLFPDFVTELTASWNKPLSTRASMPGYAPFLEHEGADKAGLLNPPPMESSLAAYLAPAQNYGVAGPTTLPSKHCRFSYAQLEKCYRSQATTARAMSSVSMLQTYQAICLAELASLLPEGSALTELLNEIRVATDHSLRMSRCAALSLGRGMGTTVVAQRHLWLTLTDMPDRDRASYLDEPVSPEGLFGQSLDAMQTSFDLRKKQAEALQNVLPRRDAKPKANPHPYKQHPQPQPPVGFRRPGTSYQPVKRAASAAPAPQKQPTDRAPGQPAWPRPPAPGPQRHAGMGKRKQKSS